MIDVDTQNENSNDLPLEEDFAALLQEREESERQDLPTAVAVP